MWNTLLTFVFGLFVRTKGIDAIIAPLAKIVARLDALIDDADNKAEKALETIKALEAEVAEHADTIGTAVAIRRNVKNIMGDPNG